MFKYLLSFIILSSSVSFAQDPTALKYSDSIKAQDMSVYLHRLASDEFEGRETGQPGQKLAAKYIAAHFASVGIPPLKDNTYFQSMPLLKKFNQSSALAVGGHSYTFLKDFYYFPGFDDTELKVENVMFLGYGIDDPAYSDYKDVDVSKSVLLIMNGEPVGKDGKSLITGTEKFSDWSNPGSRKRIYATRTYKPKAVLIVMDSIEAKAKNYDHYISSPTLKLDMEGRKGGVPIIYISKAIAEDILQGSGKSLSSLQTEISNAGKPVNQSINTNLSINISKKGESLTSENVLGYVEGTDLKDQLVVITAHYDHLGISEGKTYYGADDDGSGTSAVMELAKTFALAKKEGHGPRRSMLFMTVAGEEKGLLGSEYYSEKPVFPLANTVADLNIDMIGRIDDKHKDDPNYIYVIGSDKISTDLHKINEQSNSTYTHLKLDYTYNDPKDPNKYYYRSDHYNFAKHNIPVIFYFNGVHADYHKPTDTVEKIDFQKMEKITKLVFFTAWDLANRTERIKSDVVNDFKSER